MIETCYISCACNQLPHAVDWGRNNLVCYAANHAVAIYDPFSKTFGSVLATLHAHTNRVNVVRWIKSSFPYQEKELISASSDGTAIIWSMVDSNRSKFQSVNVLQTGEPLVTCDAIYITYNSLESIICTCSVNGDLRLWFNSSDKKITVIKTLNLNRKLPITVRLAKLEDNNDGSSNILLFIAMEDSSVELFTMLNSSYLDEK